MVVTFFVIADPNRQRQAPVAFFGDHPVLHIAQPVHLAGVAKFGDPLDLIDHVHDLVTQAGGFLFSRDLLARFVVQFAHIDEPLIHQTEDQRCVAAPADGVTMRVLVHAIESAFVVQIVEDIVRHLVNIASGEPAKAFQESAIFGEGRQRGQSVNLAELEVLRTAARRDVDDARTFDLADFIPGDDAVEVRHVHRLDGGQFIERAGRIPNRPSRRP